MAHVPHLLLPGPWQDPEIALPESTRHHLARVLRRRDGAAISYTDGAGAIGEGSWQAGTVRRGVERVEPRPQPPVTLAVAPPQRAERARFAVEKLAELGVDRLVWLTTAHGAGRAPRPEKAHAWAAAALEQSRGAWLLVVDGPVAGADLDRPLWVADRTGGSAPAAAGGVTFAVGPEGGFAARDLPPDAVPVTLGGRTLRTETAAVAGAILALQAASRFPAPIQP